MGAEFRRHQRGDSGISRSDGHVNNPGSGAAQITGKPGLLGWAWRGGGPGFGSAAVQSGLVSVATNASFEGGIAVGSYIDAIGCPCGYEKDSGWLWRGFVRALVP